MDLSYGADLDDFRVEARTWLEANLTGTFAELRGRGGPGDEHTLIEERRVWERHLAADGWIGLGWPKAFGGRGLGLWHEVIWTEEYARARGPGRLGHIGEQLAAPTIMAFGTEEQQHRFLPPILNGTELWCQGYSEPDAGSDLANVSTKAELVDGEWIIDGQKVWTSLAHLADWCFVLVRTERESQRHRGLSFLLVPMHQPGIEIRPINQLTGDSEFNETWFSGARTAAENLLGAQGEGWRAAMALLGFERGVSTLGQQLGFDAELAAVIRLATERGRSGDPVLRQRLADMWIRLRIMRLTSLRALSADASAGGTASPAGMIGKLYWASLHRDLGELALDVMGMEATVGGLLDDDVVGRLRRVFLFSRADTIYGGSNQIQRNIIGERGLGLPR